MASAVALCDCMPVVPVAPLVGVTPRAGAASSVFSGGTSVIAVYGGTLGSKITNPLTAADQGTQSLIVVPTAVTQMIGPFNTYAIGADVNYDDDRFQTLTTLVPQNTPAEPLYISLVGPAGLAVGGTTIELFPGETWRAPTNCANDVWVNAASSGHRFSVVTWQPRTQLPTAYTGAFPPSGPTGLLDTIPTYPYAQYQSDDDIQAFFAAMNAELQAYLDWFNALRLPDYRAQYGGLLDLVGSGLYGLPRPTLFSGRLSAVGPVDTFPMNTEPFNAFELVDNITNVAATSDDTYQRILTWHLWRGDGYEVSPAWLKRRVLRFLYGTGGTGYDGSASQVSVIADDDSLSITIVTALVRLTRGPINTMPYNSAPFNASASDTLATFAVPATAPLFKEAVDTGALDMPVQYNTTCRIGPLGVTHAP